MGDRPARPDNDTADLRIPAGSDRAGITREAPFTFRFEGHPVNAHPGETIAAALLAAGYRELRRTRVADRPRGLFCAIGTCFDCLVSVEGGGPVRACVTPVRPDIEVEVSHGG